MKAAFVTAMLSVALPAVAAVGCISYLATHVTAVVLRDLSLAWTCLAFFGNFDFGAGRVIGRAAATCIPTSREAIALKYAGLAAQAGIGAVGASLGLLALGMFGPEQFWGEHVLEVTLLALAIPLTTCMSGFRFRWEAAGRYHRSAFSSTVLNVASYIVPLASVHLGSTDRLAGLAIGSRLICVVLLIRLLDPVSIGEARLVGHEVFKTLRGLLKLGAWNSLYSGLALITTYVDRGIVAAYFTSTISAAYNLACDMAQRAGIVPALAIRVVAPTLDRLTAQGGHASFLRWSYAFGALFCVICALAQPVVPWLMQKWLHGRLGGTPALVVSYWLLVVGLCGYNYLLTNAFSSTQDFKTPALVQAWLFIPFVAPLLYFGSQLNMGAVVIVLAARASVETGALHLMYWRRAVWSSGRLPTALLVIGLVLTIWLTMHLNQFEQS